MFKKIATIMLILLFIPAIASAEGFEGFDVVILGQENSENTTYGESKEGLTVKPGTWSIENTWECKKEDDEFYVYAYLDIQITNWTTSDLGIADSLSSEIVYHDSYSFSGEPIFSLNSLGMLERLDGKLRYKIPLVVALAKTDELEVIIHALSEDYIFQVDLSAASAVIDKHDFPFSFDKAQNDFYEFSAGNAWIAPFFEGGIEEVARWFFQPFIMINWSHEPMDLNEDILNCSLVYLDRYAFQSTVRFQKKTIEPLETVRGFFAIRIPLIVAEAGKGETELRMSSPYDEYQKPLEMCKQNSWTVEAVPDAQYGFSLNNGWYESDNHTYSAYAICLLKFRLNKGNVLSISYDVGGGGYAYGMISKVDQMLPLDLSMDGELAFRDADVTDTLTFTGKDSLEHFVCIKYKTGSGYGGDVFRFKVSIK